MNEVHEKMYGQRLLVLYNTEDINAVDETMHGASISGIATCYHKGKEKLAIRYATENHVFVNNIGAQFPEKKPFIPIETVDSIQYIENVQLQLHKSFADMVKH